MKKLHKYLLFFVLTSMLGCEEEESLSPDNEIYQLTASGAEVSINHETHNIDLIFDYGIDISDVWIDIELPQGAKSEPDFETSIDLPSLTQIEVTAENGDSVFYDINVGVMPKLLSFQVYDRDATIVGNSIVFNVYQSSDLSAIQPSVTLSDNTSISPSVDEPIDFTDPVIFTVSSGDGLSIEYTVSVKYFQGLQSLEMYAGEYSKSSTHVSDNVVVFDVAYSEVRENMEESLLNFYPILLDGFSKNNNLVFDQIPDSPILSLTDPLGNIEEYSINIRNVEGKIYSVEHESLLSSYWYDDNINVWGEEDDLEGIYEDNWWLITLWSDVDLENLILNLNLSEYASVEPDPNEGLDYTQDQYFTVTSQTGITEDYVVRVKTRSIFMSNDGRGWDYYSTHYNPNSFSTYYRCYDKIEKAHLISSLDNLSIELEITENEYVSDEQYASISFYSSQDLEGVYELQVTLVNGDTFLANQRHEFIVD